jgi:ABC-type multidrug transport system fused ATPase/permease subunit
VFLAYASSLYGPFSELAGTFTELQAAAASADRIFEVLDEPHTVDDPRARAPRERAVGEVRFEDVRFGYADGDSVLHGISFGGRPGQLVALVGPTGAGKSTILSLLLRLYDPAAGRITLDGDDLRGLPMDWVREQIAFVPQDPVLFPISVRENIRYGRLDAYDVEVEAAANLANILDELRADPRGLDTPIGERGITLSGGQRQRVAIARAFLKNAPILLLDEPTSALDAATEALVMDAVDRLLVGRTALVVAHRLATVRRADVVLVVEGGRIVQRGTHEELLQRPGLYARLHAARFLFEDPNAPQQPPARERVEVSHAGTAPPVVVSLPVAHPADPTTVPAALRAFNQAPSELEDVQVTLVPELGPSTGAATTDTGPEVSDAG